MSRTDLYVPQLQIIEEGGAKVLYALVLVPHSCFKAKEITCGVPEGFQVIPEALPISLHLEKAGNRCLPALSTILFRHQIDPEKLKGHTSIIGFTVLSDGVLGSGSLSITSSGSALPNSDSLDPWPYMSRGVI